MSAKKYSPGKKAPAATNITPATAIAVGAPSLAAAQAPAAEPAWIDSADPKRRTIAKILFVALWVYVAALWLLALDQWFNWGIFGPKIPPVP